MHTIRIGMPAALLILLAGLAPASARADDKVEWKRNTEIAGLYACHKAFLTYYYFPDLHEPQIPAKARAVVGMTESMELKSNDDVRDIIVTTGKAGKGNSAREGFIVYLPDGAAAFYPLPEGTPKTRGPRGQHYYKLETREGPVYVSEFEDHRYGRQVEMARDTFELPLLPEGYEEKPSRKNKKAWKRYQAAMEKMFDAIAPVTMTDLVPLTSSLRKDFDSLSEDLCDHFDGYESDEGRAALAGISASCKGALSGEPRQRLASANAKQCLGKGGVAKFIGPGDASKPTPPAIEDRSSAATKQGHGAGGRTTVAIDWVRAR